MPTPTVDRKAFLEWVLSKEGCSYIYGGKGPCVWKDRKLLVHDFADANNRSLDVYDCSGLITAGLYALNGPNWRTSHSAHDLATLLPKVSPSEVAAGPLKPGTLACYGKENEAGQVHIDHVMVVVNHDKGAVFGACQGGRDTTSPEIAKQQGAKVRFRPRLDYRRDLKWFVHLPLHEERATHTLSIDDGKTIQNLSD